MGLRLNSLKTRTAVAIAALIVALLVANGLYLVLSKRRELKADIEQRAVLFALLTRTPICMGFEYYYASGYYKFRELMRDHLQLNPDVERIVIINVSGRILFDTADLATTPPLRGENSAERQVEDPERLDAIKRLEHTLLRHTDAAGNDTLEVIAPYIEDWGRHRLSVAYFVSYKNLRPRTMSQISTIGGLMLLSLLLSVIVGIGVATRITHPLEELTEGAKGIAEGNFERRLRVTGNDEIHILAEAFNHMTERLKENVQGLEESNKKLAMVNEELKELDRMKSDLLANVSHELRTPLTAIKGYTDYIKEGKLGAISEKQEKGLLVVQRNLDRLAKSINALLDFSRMDLGRITLNLQPFNLLHLVEQILTTLRSEIDRRGLVVTARVAPDLPTVVADREKISQVIENLVINAMKFTPEHGQITISADRLEGQEHPAAEVRVTDTGIGIPKDQIGRIFTRFHQVDSSTTRRFGGVGLGLAIVRSILEAHGTAIQAESEEGRGTTFRFKLPLIEKEMEAAAPRDRSMRSHAGTVLLIDDDPSVLSTLRRFLEEEGFSVFTAATAAEGAYLARRHQPSVILLDLLLPDRHGLEVLRTLKEDPATREIPVLIVSVVNDSPRALSLGAAECVLKPLDKAAILSRVRRLLDGTAGARGTVLIVDDEADTVEFIRDALRSEAFETMTATDGRRAIELMLERRPDLVLLDIMMPEMSGFEVLEAMNQKAQLAGIPVLVLTAHGEDAAARGYALGARHFMNKPFNVRALIAEVRRQVRLGGNQGPAGPVSV